jgi:hypothetical protein
VCRGTHYDINHSHGGRPWDRYQMYRKMYTNCTYIDGNLEIVFLDGDDDYDMSFLKVRGARSPVIIPYFCHRSTESTPPLPTRASLLSASTVS